MKFLSLFSGIEAASVAWHPLGAECAAVAEIEPFPCAVLKHHYPDVPNLGDVTKITEEQIKALGHIDLVVFGAPCQDLSVAGKRKGMLNADGTPTRSGLFFAAVQIAKWSGARFWLYENVPGAFTSSKGADFAAVVAEMAGLRDIAIPANGWGSEGCAVGDNGMLEWACLDAQWFGLAQRRRRLFALLDTGDWANRPPILLEPQSLRRDTPPRRETRQDAPAHAASGAGERRSRWDGVEHPHPTLNQSAKVSGGVGASNQELFSQRGAYLVGDKPLWRAGDQANAELLEDMAGTLNCNKGQQGGILFDVTHSLRAEGFDASEDGTGRGTPLVPVVASTLKANNGGGGFGSDPSETFLPVAFHPTQDPISSMDGSTHALGCGSKGGQASVAVAFPIDTMNALRNDQGPRTSVGIGEQGDPSFTITKGHSHAVAYAFQPRIARNGRGDMGDVVNALQAQSGETGKGDAAPCVAVQASQSGVRLNDTVGTLDANYGSRRHNGVMTNMAVRRLTPQECELLQGFPSYYTQIPWKKKPAADCPDGPRYKALGNSMAVPVMRWIGERIANTVAKTEK